MAGTFPPGTGTKRTTRFKRLQSRSFKKYDNFYTKNRREIIKKKSTGGSIEEETLHHTNKL